ncbi:glycosyltransferase, partial [bacterium]|nr:glycosyltransferase [bacterium]
MNATLLTLGTRGDVQPYLALALGLRDAGHRVKLATSVDFQEWVSSLGLAFAPLRISICGLLSDPMVGAVFESKRAALRAYRKSAPLMPGLLEDAFEAAQGADLVLFHPKILNALDIAERLGIPAMA